MAIPLNKVVGMPSELSNLEVFLLALIEADVRTPYDMMRKVDISVGSSLPALKRLEKEKFVRVSRGPRRSKIFALTMKGSTAFRKNWKSVVEETGPELESILRAATLLWVGRPNPAANGERAKTGKQLCGEFLNKQGAALRQELKKRKSSNLLTQRPGRVDVNLGLRERYLWLKRSVEIARREAEISSLFALSRRIWPPEQRNNKR